MSLQDIMAQRAAIHFQNELGPTSGGTPSTVLSDLAKAVSEKIERRKQEKLIAENNRQLLDKYINNRPDKIDNEYKLNNISSGRQDMEIKRGLKLDQKTGMLQETFEAESLGTKEQLEIQKLRQEIESGDIIKRTVDEFFSEGSDMGIEDLYAARITPSDANEMLKQRNIRRQQSQIQSSISRTISPDPIRTIQREPAGSINQSQERLVAKGFDIEQNIPKDVVDIQGIKIIGEEEAKIKASEKQKLKWSDDAAEREIKNAVIDPKLNYFMEVGGRAYKELREEAKALGIELDFSAKGPEVYKNMLVKKGLSVAKFTPLMDALDKLRPELGTELMRQLGAFRSAQMAEKFEKTIAAFSGNIRQDIADMTTTISKNQANVDLIDDDGNVLPDSVRDKRMRQAEANLIRKYNFMYRDMGLIDKPYLAGYDYEDIAERSTFNESEEAIIRNAIEDNPGYDRIQIISKLIERGLL